MFQRTSGAAGFEYLRNTRTQYGFEYITKNLFQPTLRQIVSDALPLFVVDSFAPLPFCFVHLHLAGEASLFIKPFSFFNCPPAVLETPTLVLEPTDTPTDFDTIGCVSRESGRYMPITISPRCRN